MSKHWASFADTRLLEQGRLENYFGRSVIGGASYRGLASSILQQWQSASHIGAILYAFLS